MGHSVWMVDARRASLTALQTRAYSAAVERERNRLAKEKKSSSA